MSPNNRAGSDPQQLLHHRLVFCPADVTVRWDEAVRLRCVSPSNLATLTWTGPASSSGRSVQAADGGLGFLASADTFGTYSCVAEEAGTLDVVATFNVQPAAPRSARPGHDVGSVDEPYEAVVTEEASSAPDTTASVTHDTEPGQNCGSDPTAASQSDNGPSVRFGEKSYFSELLVVSLLLVVSVGVLTLGGLLVWRRSRTGPEHKPVESTPSLNPEAEPALA